MAAARGLSAAGAPAHRLRVNLGDRDLIAAASPPPPAAGAGTRTLDSSPVAERARDVASLRERRLDVGGALGVDALAAEPSHHDIPAHRPHLRAEVSSVEHLLVRDLHRPRPLGEDLRLSDPFSGAVCRGSRRHRRAPRGRRRPPAPPTQRPPPTTSRTPTGY